MLNDLLGKKSSNTKIAELKTDSVVTVIEPEELVDYLNKHFAEIGPNLASNIPVDEANIRPHNLVHLHEGY